MNKVGDLYIGGDESNNSGDTKGEFDLACFSIIHEDSIIKPQLNRRDIQEVNYWLFPPIRDYRFTIMTDEKERRNGKNLLIAMPCLISDYLKCNSTLAKNLHVYLDGDFSERAQKKLIEKIFKTKKVENIELSCYIKKTPLDIKRKNNTQKAFSKRPYCPDVVHFADLWVHDLYSSYGRYSDLLKHEKLVPFKAF